MRCLLYARGIVRPSSSLERGSMGSIHSYNGLAMISAMNVGPRRVHVIIQQVT